MSGSHGPRAHESEPARNAPDLVKGFVLVCLLVTAWVCGAATSRSSSIGNCGYFHPGWGTSQWLLIGTALGALVLVSAFFFRSERLALCRLGRMQGRLSERERIARELHDTLLQAVQALLLHLSVWEMDLPAEYQHGVAIALSRARATVVEGRNRIVMLRRTEPQTLDLLEELSRIADREALHPGPELRISAVGEPHPLRLELVEQLIDIAREAIRNGIRHARAQRIDVNVVYEKSRLVLHIVDDGLGIERAALQAAAAAAHFGLIGMQERAELLGGRLQISARQPRGTHIQVAVPTNSEAESGAFETPYGRPWQRMLGVSLSTL